jgi:chemotaxis regulatin CheY-phosphate phosphatase CheZ
MPSHDSSRTIPMTPARAKEVLYDSETMLRLVDNELSELRDEPETESNTTPADLGAWLSVLQRASAEIGVVLQTLQNSRQALHEVAFERLQDSTAKIQEVSSAAETAATDILDSVDRAQQLVDSLDRLSATDSDEAANVRASLRDELFSMTGALQFQDITAQQLGHVSSMLADVEQRLHGVTTLLGGMPGVESMVEQTRSGASNKGEPVFSESASTLDAARRQADADALVRQRRTP